MQFKIRFKILLTILITAGITIGVGAFALPAIQYFNTDVQLKKALWDVTSSTGSSGQVLSSTGTSTKWINQSGGGGGASGINTSSPFQFAYYITSSTVTGTPFVQFANNSLVITTNTLFTTLVASSTTSTNAYVSSLLSFLNANGTSLTSTNLNISGLTNLANTIITNVSSTNLSVSGLTGLQGLTFTTANGTSITSTNLYVSGQFAAELAHTIVFSSSSINATLSSGSTTRPIGTSLLRARTINKVSCFTTSTAGVLATTTIRVGNGAVWSNALQATSSKSGGFAIPNTTLSSNNTFAQGLPAFMEVGNIVGTFDYINCTFSDL